MKFFSSLQQTTDDERKMQESFVPSFHTVEYTLSTIVDKINNIDNLNEDEIKNIIYRQYSMILNYDLFLKSAESRKCAQQLFTNKKFLKIFLDIVGLIRFTNDQITCINKLAYDYFVTENKDNEVSDLLLRISYQINNIMVIRLSSKLGMKGARILSMIAKSSFKEEKNIHRINTFLLRYNGDLSVQDIIDIYCILFDHFTKPFIYTMLESKPIGMTQEQAKRFDNISCAILTLLNAMTSVDMKTVLFNYAYTLKLINNKNAVRFSLKSALTYPRMLEVISSVELDDFDDLYIP